jgi:hypothetical protein
VTVTVKMMAVLPVQLRVDAPEPEMLVGLSEHEIPDDGEVVAPRDTTPVNPLIGSTVTVKVAGEPALTVTLLGVEVIVKSTTWNVRIAK